jgi:hypothetical protein
MKVIAKPSVGLYYLMAGDNVSNMTPRFRKEYLGLARIAAAGRLTKQRNNGPL